MVLFLSFATLALAGMVVASPLKRSPSFVVSLSTDAASVDSVDEIRLITTVKNPVSSCHKKSCAITNILILRFKERARHQSAEAWER
jgi:hypothetical protein